MRHLVLFIERNLEEKDVIRLRVFSQSDGPLMGNGSFKSSSLVPGVKEGLYLGAPPKEKLPKNSQSGSILVGAISYGKLSLADQGENKNLEKHSASYRISFVVPSNKIDEGKGKDSFLSSKKNVYERLKEEVKNPTMATGHHALLVRTLKRVVWLVVLMVLFNGVSSTEVVLDNSTIPASVNIGLLYSFNTSVGRIVKVAGEAAVEDVNSDPSILGKTTLKV
ncbi:hypothetical protein RJT34_14228 [Clitoria ternatea]|uniref:Uncharacterized protein n=1 Tax=Clitoria ternatea TaxID=43366 RepID=A0AAN9JQ00_CLITE